MIERVPSPAAAPHQLSRASRGGTAWWHARVTTVYSIVLMALAALTDVKVGPVQLAELVTLVGLPLVLIDLVFGKPGAARARPKLPYGLAYIAIFLSLTAVGALVAYWRGGFAVPADASSILRQPGWISFARIVQLSLAYLCFVVVLRSTYRRPKVLGTCVKIYVYSATFSAAYGIVSWLLLRFVGLDLGGAYGEDGVRLKAFFVEGGPFGLFSISALVMVVAQLRMSLLRRSTAIFCIVVLGLGFLLAQSKSATLAAVAISIVAAVLSKEAVIRRHWRSLLAGGLVVAVSTLLTGADSVFDRIASDRAALSATPELFGDDPNILMGRVAGALIVPEMLIAHPLLGIGIGNYSLLRDSAAYNRLLPAVDAWDLHGLGLYGFSAEVGLFAVLSFVGFFGRTALAARRVGAPYASVALCCFPLFSLVFGVQPTFLYPWIVSALGVALADAYCRGLR